jgi:hypothetical protein
MPVITAIAGRGSPHLASSSLVPFSSRQNFQLDDGKGSAVAVERDRTTVPMGRIGC